MNKLNPVGNNQRAIDSISPHLKDQEKLKLTQTLGRGVCIKTEQAVADNLFIPQAPCHSHSTKQRDYGELQ